MKIFETHAHLNSPKFDNDRDAVIRNAFHSGVEYIINVGVDEETSLKSIELARKYDRIFAAVGFHPHDASKFDETILLKLKNQPKVVAIGEIGLDFFRNLSPRNLQIRRFGEQLEPLKIEAAFDWARRCDLMIVAGTSAVVYPAAAVPYEAKRRGATVVEVNPYATELTRLCDFALAAPSGEVMPALWQRVRQLHS